MACRRDPRLHPRLRPRRLLIALLDRLRAIGVKPSPEAREEARAVATDWKRGKRIGTETMFKQETFAFLHLVGVFGLVEDVGGTSEVLDLVVSISGRERAVDAFVVLGLDLDQHMPSKSHFSLSWTRRRAVKCLV
ncbi:FRIGIDA-like protein 1 [Zea mays]|uniref:FRIGIDA-like protein n=1 Tax=Zea mays TaxID=4577 RepID=A0A1D6JSI3_MAIZE|nr:FRIGIDA-like protein 1 [Zea mays]